ncbi:MAG: bifunctional demethylmenaquinone methyltransferase/2-methoxy-6-polyprenyl-1,4-benzoquinol methylase UbiE [Candidatus Zixiibacteriota bacterium]
MESIQNPGGRSDASRTEGHQPVADSFNPRDNHEPSRVDVWRMFDRIAPRYDLLNRLLSFRRDVAWRNRLCRHLPSGEHLSVLDLSTGTGDVLISLLTKSRRVSSAVGVDMSPVMLRLAADKVAQRGLARRVTLLRADVRSLPFEDNSFDVVTIAFGIRNMPDVPAALQEMRRVLVRGGKVLILEFSLPRHPIVRRLYPFHLKGILPRVGAAVSGDGYAYRYLNETVQTFPCGEMFEQLMSQAGFAAVASTELTFGVASIYEGVKAHHD